MLAAVAASDLSKVLGVLGPVDLVVIAALLLGAGLGFWSGLVWQLLRILSVLLSLWAAWLLHPVVGGFVPATVDEGTGRLVSAAVIFAVALAACYAASFLLRGVVNALKPQLPDRVAGAVFGLIKAGLLVGVLAFLILRYADDESGIHRHVAASRGAQASAACVRTLLQVLPEQVRASLARGSGPGIGPVTV